MTLRAPAMFALGAGIAAAGYAAAMLWRRRGTAPLANAAADFVASASQFSGGAFPEDTYFAAFGADPSPVPLVPSTGPTFGGAYIPLFGFVSYGASSTWGAV